MIKDPRIRLLILFELKSINDIYINIYIYIYIYIYICITLYDFISYNLTINMVNL